MVQCVDVMYAATASTTYMYVVVMTMSIVNFILTSLFLCGVLLIATQRIFVLIGLFCVNGVFGCCLLSYLSLFLLQ